MTTEPFLPVQQAADEQWLSVAQAARELGVSGDTVRRWVDQGKLTAARTVLGRVISPTAVHELAEARSAS